MRPGYSACSVPNCSAMTSGEWLGSMNAARADAAGAAGHMADQDGRGRGNARHAVVFNQPVARIAQAVGVLRQIPVSSETTGQRRCLR